MKKYKRLLSILLSLIMMLSLFKITLATSVSAAEFGWHPVSSEEIQEGDIIIITMQAGDGYYGLSNDNGSSAAPAAVPFTALDNTDFTQEKLIGSDEDILKCSWIVGFNESNFTFSTSSGDMLWCFNENNGVRVGDNDKTDFLIEGGYLMNTASSRYLGVYNKQDWRCYLNTSNNISGQYVVFWKYTEDIGTYNTSGDDPEPEPVSGEWYEVQLDDINDGDEVIFTSTKNSTTYGLKNSATSRAPEAVRLDIIAGCLSGTDEDLVSCIWTVERDGDSFAFRNSTGDMLYCLNKNDGVRIGGNNGNIDFTVEDGYLYDEDTERYLGVYNELDWRCYTANGAGSNIYGQILQFWKCAEPDVPETISSVDVTDIAAPVATETLDTEAATATKNVTLSQVKWQPEDTEAAYDTVYTATVYAEANENYVFADDVAATVNGETAVTELNEDGKLAISYTFAKTEPINASPAFKTCSITLGAQLGLNFYINMPETEGISYDESYVDFSINGKEIGRKSVDEGGRNEKGYYRFTANLNVAQMAEKVTAVFHYKENEEDQTLTDEFSIKDYITAFESVRDQEPYAGAAELVDAIADYGHYTQVYLADANQWTYGVDYAAMDVFPSNPYSPEQISEAASGLRNYGFKNISKLNDIDNYGMSLTLDSRTAFNLFVKPADGYTGPVSATVDGKQVSIKKTKDGRYKVTVPDISAHQLGSALNFVIKTEQGESKLTTYPLYYVRTALGDVSKADEITRDAMVSVYRYYKAADNYKNGGETGRYIYQFGTTEGRVAYTSEYNQQENPKYNFSTKWVVGYLASEQFSGTCSDDILENSNTDYRNYIYVWYDEDEKNWYTEGRRWIDHYNDNQRFPTK